MSLRSRGGIRLQKCLKMGNSRNWSNRLEMKNSMLLVSLSICFLFCDSSAVKVSGIDYVGLKVFKLECVQAVLAEAQRSRPYQGNRYGGPKPTATQSEFSSARSRVALSCDTGKIVLKMNFVQPFRGVAQIGPKATRECIVRGDSRRQSYVLTVPLDGCGTCKGHNCSPGTFVNTLTIRYHPTLELDGDEVKTVICKYQAGSVQATG